MSVSVGGGCRSPDSTPHVTAVIARSRTSAETPALMAATRSTPTSARAVPATALTVGTAAGAAIVVACIAKQTSIASTAVTTVLLISSSIGLLDQSGFNIVRSVRVIIKRERSGGVIPRPLRSFPHRPPRYPPVFRAFFAEREGRAACSPARYQEVLMLLRALAIWFGLLVAAVANGTVRELWLTPTFGGAVAHLISALVLAAIVAVVAWLTI